MLRRMMTLCLLTLVGCGDATGMDVHAHGVEARSGISARQAILEAMRAHMAATGRTGLAVTVQTVDGLEVFRHTIGSVFDYDVEQERIRFLPMSFDRAIPVASASKLIASVTILSLVDAGMMSLEDTTGDLLGWGGQLGQITLRSLLAFQSGLPTSISGVLDALTSAEQSTFEALGLTNCVDEHDIQLQGCARTIYRIARLAPFLGPDASALFHVPGEVMDYGTLHMMVAGAMAEVAHFRHERRWVGFDGIFAEKVREPLGLSADAHFYSDVFQRQGTTNPRIPGGLAISIDDYNRVLGLLAALEAAEHPLALDMMHSQLAPETEIGSSPYSLVGLEFPYGLGSWIECDRRLEIFCGDRPIVSSGGAFGFYPWIDPTHGYFAIIGALDYIDPLASIDSFFHAVTLRPLIVDLIQEMSPEGNNP